MNAANSAPFREVGTVVAGQHIEAALYNRNGNGTPYLTGPDDFGPTVPTISKWTDSPKVFAAETDVLLTVKGAGVGKSNLGINAAIGRQLMALRPDSAMLDRRFLFRFLQSCESQLARLGQGATVPGIAKPTIEKVLIPLLPLHEQQRIADILDKADSVRRKRRNLAPIANDLLRAQFFDMYGDPVANSRRWPTVPLASYGEVTTGNTPPRSDPQYFGDAIEWIKSDNVNTSGHYLTRADEGLSERGKRIGRVVPAGSTLVTCIAGSPECVGNAALADREVAFNQQINAITPHAKTDSLFLYSLICFSKVLIQRASTASMKGMVSKGKFGAVQVISVPYSEQVPFGVAFQSIHTLREKLDSAAQESEALFHSLVYRAFRGEL